MCMFVWKISERQPHQTIFFLPALPVKLFIFYAFLLIFTAIQSLVVLYFFIYNYQADTGFLPGGGD